MLIVNKVVRANLIIGLFYSLPKTVTYNRVGCVLRKYILKQACRQNWKRITRNKITGFRKVGANNKRRALFAQGVIRTLINTSNSGDKLPLKLKNGSIFSESLAPPNGTFFTSHQGSHDEASHYFLLKIWTRLTQYLKTS